MLHSLAALTFQDMKTGFRKLGSLGNSPMGATGRGTLQVGWLCLPVPIPVSQFPQQGCAGEISKDLAWRLGSQSSLLLQHQPLCNPLALPAKGVGRNPHRRVLLGVQLSLRKGSTLAQRHGRALRAPSFAPRRAAHAPASHAPAVAAQRPRHCPLARPACAFGDGMGRPGWAGGRQG